LVEAVALVELTGKHTEATRKTNANTGKGEKSVDSVGWCLVVKKIFPAREMKSRDFKIDNEIHTRRGGVGVRVFVSQKLHTHTTLTKESLTRERCASTRSGDGNEG